MKLRHRFLNSCVLLGLSASAYGQLRDVDTLQNIGDAAQQITAAGRGGQMIEWLGEIAQLCPAGAEGRQCRLYVGFARAYVLEREAESVAGEQRVEALQRAGAQYDQVLKEAPGHAATVNNRYLLYRALGQDAEAKALLQAAMAGDQSGQVALLVGQLSQREGDQQRALNAFTRAAELRPWDQAPRRGMVEALTARLPASTAELESRLREWRLRYPEASEMGYRALMEQEGGINASTIERAFPMWTTVLARQGLLSRDRVAALRVSGKPKADLLGYLARPDVVPGEEHWWMQGRTRRSALAEAALLQGRLRLAEGSNPAAAACWEAGVAIAPEHDAFLYGELRAAPWVRLDLERELASAYTRSPELDRTGTKFDALLEDLYQGKGGALGARDLDAIQRYHVALGLLLAERNVWTQSLPWRGAMYQLQNAIVAAGERERRERAAYQPLPEVKMALATGYLALKQPSNAAKLLLDASEAHLDMDQLEEAGRALENAQGIGGLSAEGAGRLSALREVLERRRWVQVASASADSEQSDDLLSWCKHESWPQIRSGVRFYSWDFLPRQRLKVIGDLIMAGLLTGAHAQYCSAVTLSEAITKLGNLVGSADLLRLEALAAEAARGIDVERSGVWMGPVALAPASADQAWSVYLPGDPTSFEARISTDLALSARIKAATGRVPVWEALTTVRNGVVTLKPTAAVNQADLERQLLGIKGVKQVQSDLP